MEDSHSSVPPVDAPALQLYQRFWHASAVPALLLDTGGRIVQVNQAFVRAGRFADGAALVGRGVADVFVDRDAAGRALERLWADGGWTGGARLRAADGAAFEAQLHVTVVLGADGEPGAAVMRVMGTSPEAVELQNTVSLLRAVADNFPDGTLTVVGRDLTVAFTAGLGFQHYQIDPQTLVGRPVAEIFAPLGADLQQTILAAYRETFQGRPQSFDIVVGTQHHALQTVPLLGRDGVIERILSVGRNVTAQRLAEQELRARERRQSAVARLGQLALGGASLAVVRQQAVALVAETLHVDLVGLFDLLPDRSGLRLNVGVGWHEGAVGQAVMAATADSHAGYTLTSGQPVIVQDVREESRFPASPLIVEHGAVSGVSVVVGTPAHPMGVLCACSTRPRTFVEDDVHMLQATANVVAAAAQRQLAEVTLRQGEARFRSLIANVSDLIMTASLKGAVTFVSASIGGMLGYAPDDLIGRQVIDFVHPDDVSRVTDARRAALAHPGVSIALECRVRHRDGSWRVLDSVGRQVEGTDGPILVVNSRDVTERRTAEVALRAREAELARQGRLFREMEITASVGGWELNLLTGSLYWTDQTYRIHDANPETFTPTLENAVDFYAPEGRGRIAAAIEEAIRTGHGWDLELPLVTAAGRRIWVRAMGQAEMEQGRAVRLFGGFQDVTARRRLEEQFRQAQKMEAIGQLSGGVAHDFNNILTVIQGHVALLDTAAGDSPDLLESVREVRQAADRASSLTRQLLAFSRQQVLQRRDVDLNDVVGHISRMLRRILGEDVELNLQYVRTPLYVHADPGTIEQVLLNLAVNARDAMPGGGRLTIETSEAVLTVNDAMALPIGRPGSYACLSVSDTGSGIAPEHLPHIFEPFFTTKDVGQGTGLGLATVHGIVEQHEGWVDVHSTVGEGTTFRLYLPRTARTPAPTLPPPAIPDVDRGTETILLVEDESSLRALGRRVLTRLGYQVLEAGSGVEALEVWQAHKAEIDLLLTDLVMPDGVSGLDLAEQLLGERPELRVLCTSGYSAAAAAGFDRLPGLAFLAKPFKPADLGRAVRQVLDAP
ncbi:MAG: PAS domain-containing protein [Acidobacteriota bacterium]|nr:PAS domain-containing protein [Acidobacteriota bacterium]